jgi:hypothetical protein
LLYALAPTPSAPAMDTLIFGCKKLSTDIAGAIKNNLIAFAIY